MAEWAEVAEGLEKPEWAYKNPNHFQGDVQTAADRSFELSWVKELVLLDRVLSEPVWVRCFDACSYRRLSGPSIARDFPDADIRAISPTKLNLKLAGFHVLWQGKSETASGFGIW